MKFLCVTCDEAMKLTRTTGPDEGSLSVIFGCPVCGRETAMLTNSMETQMVRSLGVKIGGRTVPAEPMEMVRSSLADGREAVSDSDAGGEQAFPREDSLSKCPFGDVVAEAYAQNSAASEIVWTKRAEERLARIPLFARPMAKKGVEMHAREHGYNEINDTVMDEVKGRFDM